jgi:hypothetical protein
MATIMRRKRVRLSTPEPIVAEPPVTLVIRPDVIRSIASAAASSEDMETGGPLIGTVQSSWEPRGERLIAAVFGTVPPGPQLRAGLGSVGMGARGDGERAASALRWWRKVTGLDLCHLGDWHKHPSGLPEPSTGDRATARQMRSESGCRVWLTGIAVCDRLRDRFGTKGVIVQFSHEHQLAGQVRFYREKSREGLVPMPARVEAAAIPRLPVLPWHVTDPVRFAVECRLLGAAGVAVAVEPSIADGRFGLSLRLQPERGGPYVAFTPARYPLDAPVLFDHGGERLPLVGEWSPTRFLVDVLKARS